MADTTPEPAPIPPCPRCAVGPVTRAGATHNGVPSFRCNGCGRRFVARPRKGPVPDATKDLVRRLLGERLSLRAIARAVGVSRAWLQQFVNALYRDETPWEPGPLTPPPKKSRRRS
jgi:insertion element IS1 protein InsB